MDTDPSVVEIQEESEPLRWVWVVGGVVLGVLLISVFLWLVDPGFAKPGVDGLVVSLSVMLVGILVGYKSEGETIREAAVAGLVLLLLTGAVAAGLLGMRVPVIVWLVSPFYAATIALVGGYVGEMLQGTLEEAHIDKAVDWPWVFVAVVIGFALSTYAIFLTRALMPPSPAQDLMVFAASFFVTGLIVGYFSPGMTMVEPAIAAGGMIVLHAGFIVLWFEAAPPLEALLTAFVVGTLLALFGGWLGETLQRVRQG